MFNSVSMVDQVKQQRGEHPTKNGNKHKMPHPVWPGDDDSFFPTFTRSFSICGMRLTFFILAISIRIRVRNKQK